MFTNFYVIHPITNQKIQIWVGEYVLENVGTGAVMGVPPLDERDKEFAIKNSIKIIEIKDEDGKYINSSFINGVDNSNVAVNKVVEYFKNNNIGINKVNSYKLKDWVFARQRYWGEPFPILFDEENNIYLVEDLVELPNIFILLLII